MILLYGGLLRLQSSQQCTYAVEKAKGTLFKRGRDAQAYVTGKTVPERFHYDYSDEELGEVAARALHLAGEADEVHVDFNNNSRDFAPKAAERLRQRLGQISRRPILQKQIKLF